MREHHARRARGPLVKILKSLRRDAGLALLRAALLSGARVLVIALTRKHAHVLAELPKARRRAKEMVGKWKTARTPALRKAMPGSIWGEGGKYKPVRSREHLRSAFKYIRDEQGPGAHVWTYREGVPEEVTDQITRILRDRARNQKRRRQ